METLLPFLCTSYQAYCCHKRVTIELSRLWFATLTTVSITQESVNRYKYVFTSLSVMIQENKCFLDIYNLIYIEINTYTK